MVASYFFSITEETNFNGISFAFPCLGLQFRPYFTWAKYPFSSEQSKINLLNYIGKC